MLGFEKLEKIPHAPTLKDTKEFSAATYSELPSVTCSQISILSTVSDDVICLIPCFFTEITVCDCCALVTCQGIRNLHCIILWRNGSSNIDMIFSQFVPHFQATVSEICPLDVYGPLREPGGCFNDVNYRSLLLQPHCDEPKDFSRQHNLCIAMRYLPSSNLTPRLAKRDAPIPASCWLIAT